VEYGFPAGRMGAARLERFENIPQKEHNMNLKELIDAWKAGHKYIWRTYANDTWKPAKTFLAAWESAKDGRQDLDAERAGADVQHLDCYVVFLLTGGTPASEASPVERMPTDGMSLQDLVWLGKLIDHYLR